MVEARLLQANIDEAEVIVRLGVIANSLFAIGRTMTGSDSDLFAMLDTSHKTILLAAHVKEAAEILNRRHGGLAWRLADDGVGAGHRLSQNDLERLRVLLSRDSAFVETCFKLRKQHGFHVDQGPITEWLDDERLGPEVVLETVNTQGWRCDAAGQILFDSTLGDFERDEFGTRLVFFVRTLPALVDAMLSGFIVRNAGDMSFMDGIQTDDFSLDPVPTSAGTIAIQVKPARMIWSPFFVGMPSEEAAKLEPELCLRPSGGGPLVNVETLPKIDYPGWWIRVASAAATPSGDTLCLVCKATPGPLVFGRIGGPRYRLILSKAWKGLAPVPPDVTG